MQKKAILVVVVVDKQQSSVKKGWGDEFSSILYITITFSFKHFNCQ